ncbi:MAG: serine/threonine-protein phosphatase [Phycisphaerae bacterium]|nr:serine/threonine-protein phosphatase [Phycisphaerae bacterium]
MRRDRFLRRTDERGDLTASIAESRAARISAGTFAIAGLALVSGFVQGGLALALEPTASKLSFGIASSLTIALALVTAGLALRAKATAVGRERASERLLLLVLLIGLAAVSVAQALNPDKCNYVAGWLLFAASISAVAALVMPWTSVQAGTASLPAFAVWLVALFTIPNAGQDSVARMAIGLIGLFAAALPIGLGFLTERRFEEEEERAALSREVSHSRDELGRARIVHEAMFREPLCEGPVEVQYKYFPLREIGGDFVHIVRSPCGSRVTTTVIDVSGHGLAAALTVNRLFGELERVVAEAKGEITPAYVMTQLNRYIYLTMTAHSMFATAACVQVDTDARQVRWVVAGHPPPIVRLRNGKTERLDCTTLVLGASPPELFDPEECSRTLNVGETVIIYTDGAFEARSPAGERFGLKRLEESVAFDPPPRDFPTFLANLVARHHEGNPDDDLLVAQITFKGGSRSVAVE